MIDIPSLYLPIVVSAGLCWVAGALIWMVMPWHRSDFRALANEDAVADALRGASPGQYSIPYFADQKSMADPANAEKWSRGPIAFITVGPNGMPSMGRGMLLSFFYYLLVSVFVAYVTGRTALPGPQYLEIFQIAGAVSFAAYGFAIIQDAVWFARPWSNVGKGLFDALIYACITGGAFGWLWPST